MQLAVFLIVVMGIGLVSCAGNSNQTTNVAGHNMLENGQLATVATPAYRLGSGDKIKLNVYNEEDLSGEFDVGGDGSLSLPLVGQIQVGGLTLPEFEQKLTEKLKAYVRVPKVSAQVLNYRPFYIQGEVKNGGEYPFSNGLLIRDAVAKAGGYTYRAVTGHVFVRHANDTSERRYSLSTPVRVVPGDNIRVPERIF
jgi:polysaccharide export outer membrane protein